MRKKALLVISVSLWMTHCQRVSRVEPVTRTAFRMDTLVKISVFDRNKTEHNINQHIDACFEWMETAENRLSIHAENSEVQKINQNAAENPVSVSEDVFQVIQAGKALTKLTEGTFDITIGGIKSLWDFHQNKQAVPRKQDIQEKLASVGEAFIRLNLSEVCLTHPETQLDLGGIAKGYMVDQAICMLREAGIQSAIVEAGGDLRLLGKHPQKPHWRIGIKHPRNPHQLYGILTVDSVSVTTSGDYERYFEKEGNRYHHILDPETGYPAMQSISVTVIAPSAMKADAFATALFVMGPEKGIQFTEKQHDIECLILYEKEREILYQLSSGMKLLFKPVR